jgi:hypothetical protein
MTSMGGELHLNPTAVVSIQAGDKVVKRVQPEVQPSSGKFSSLQILLKIMCVNSVFFKFASYCHFSVN